MHGLPAKLFVVFHGMLSARGQRPMIALAIVEVMIDVSIEMFRPVKPWSGSDEHAACEPLRAIVPIGGAVVRRLLVISVWTNGRRPYFD